MTLEQENCAVGIFSSTWCTPTNWFDAKEQTVLTSAVDYLFMYIPTQVYKKKPVFHDCTYRLPVSNR